ncbi:hypothetical protein DFH09DRAFT_1310511 [Mycena vulgaris]|nr:hypothetical protein DFH09DRAFT_1310511 [Mycena vulgaris]
MSDRNLFKLRDGHTQHSASSSLAPPTTPAPPEKMPSAQSATGVEPVLVLPNYAPLVSSQLIGSLLNFFFFGTLLIQTYVYRVCFPKDSFSVKALVYFIFIAMTVCICLNAADVEFWYGTGFGDIGHFADPRNSRLYTPIMGSFIAMLVQLFFCYRIVVIRRAVWPLAILIGLIAMAQCAGGMGGGILSYIAKNSVHDRLRTIFVNLWLVGGSAADIIIAATMTALLFNVSSIPATRDAVRSVVRLVIETNALSATVALLGLILFVAVPNTTYFVAPTMILPGIYANTLLVTLNNRAIVRLTAADSTAINFAASMQFDSSAAGSTQRGSTSSTAKARAPVRTASVYSAGGPGRVLSAPAMSFARRASEAVGVAPGRNSTESKWREEEPESESEYGSDAEDRA